MLAAGHTSVLLDMFRVVGRSGQASLSTPAKLMLFGNLLPDSLPMVGVPAERTHNRSLADEMVRANRAVGYGLKVHLYSDNMTHCGALVSCPAFDKGFALRMGREAEKSFDSRLVATLDKIVGKSRAYVLHIVAEIGADLVIAGRDHITDTIYEAWSAAWSQPPGTLVELARIFDLPIDRLEDDVKRFSTMGRPPREAIYSPEARAGLFVNKFGRDLKAGTSFDAADKSAVIDMILIAEKVVKDEIEPFVASTAQAILDADPDIAHFIHDME